MATSLTTLANADYDAIEAAVMDTARGRWFLGEFARRNRSGDTKLLLAAIERLEQTVATERDAQDLDGLRFDLMEMALAISLTKTEIAAIGAAEGSRAEQIGRVVRTLWYFEDRITGMIDRCGGATEDPEAPPQPGSTASTGTVPKARSAVSAPTPTGARTKGADRAIVEAPRELGVRQGAAGLRLEAFAEVDALDIREKLKRFT